MFFWLYFLKNCGGYKTLASVKEGAQEFRIQEGAQILSQKLAENLNIIYSAEVVKIANQNSIYDVHTKDNSIYAASMVVSAIPTQLIPKIEFFPQLESARIDFYKSMKMGSVTKIVIEYEKSFWRDDGYSGQICSDTPPIALCYDACDQKHNALVIFMVDDADYSDIQITTHLAFLLHNEAARFPKKIHRKNWSQDEFSGGCYFCVPAIDSLAANYAYLTKPHHDVYFTGTETAGHWMGYMEGALESAERVVQQITDSDLTNK